jgi:hypothetical protein
MSKFQLHDTIIFKVNDHPKWSKYTGYQGTLVDQQGSGGYMVQLTSGSDATHRLPLCKNTPVVFSNSNSKFNGSVATIKRQHGGGDFSVQIGDNTTLHRVSQREIEAMYNTVDISGRHLTKFANKVGGTAVNVNDLLCSNMCKQSTTQAPLGKSKDCPQVGWRKHSESRRCLKQAIDYNNPSAWTCCNTYNTSGCNDLCLGTNKWNKSIAPLGKSKMGFSSSRNCYTKQPNQYTGQEEAKIQNCKQFDQHIVSNVPTPQVIAQPSINQYQQPSINQYQQPGINQYQQPMVQQPQRPMVQQPQRPMVGQPQRPMVQQPQRPMVGQPQQPVVNQYQPPMMRQSQQPVVNQYQQSQRHMTAVPPQAYGQPMYPGRPAPMAYPVSPKTR